MSKENPKIQLILTRGGFAEDLKTVILCVRERDANQVDLATELWKYWKEAWAKDEPLFSAFPSDDKKYLSSMLLGRLKEEKEGKDITPALAVCTILLRRDTGMRTRLIEGGLAALLAKILDSHYILTDVVERGLVALGGIATDNVDVRDELLKLGIVSTLEKIEKSHAKNHDVMWMMAFACNCLVSCGRGGLKDIAGRSALLVISEHIKNTFPGYTDANIWATGTLHFLKATDVA